MGCVEIDAAEKIIDELLGKVIFGTDEMVFMRNGQPLVKLIPCEEESTEGKVIDDFVN